MEYVKKMLQDKHEDISKKFNYAARDLNAANKYAKEAREVFNNFKEELAEIERLLKAIRNSNNI